MSNKIIAAGSVALVGAGSFPAAAPAQAYTDADCGDQTGMDITAIYGGTDDMCFSVAFGVGDYSFQAPANTVAVEVVISGAGGGASTEGYGYGGGGGEVLFIDDLDPAAVFDIYIGEGGGAASAGEASTITDGTTTYTASGGDGAAYLGGFSGNGNSYAILGDGWSQHGGGAGTAADSTNPGEGHFLNDPDFVGADNPLWPADDDTEYGGGGNGLELDGGNWGFGGDAYYDGSSWTLNGGEDGIVEIHYLLGDSSNNLASTGVDANGIGMTAGTLTLSGVALGVVAAIRRSRRAK